MTEQFDVLIVEDEPVVREAATKTLRYEGWSVDTVWDADEAVSRLKSCSYQVVLCDLMLPGIDGFDLLRLGRSACPSIPFVIVSGYATFRRTLESFRLGAFDFIPKPFDAAELVGIVDRARRFSARPDRKNGVQPEHPGIGILAGDRHHLGQHSWALLSEDGLATIGAGDTFAGTVVGVDQVELPEVGEHTLQSKQIAQFMCGDRAIHRVWAPLSGPVIAVNEDLRQDAALFGTQDPTAGWLVQLVPSQLDLELAFLSDK